MFEVIPLNAFDDNYIWVLRSDSSQSVLVVDPGDEDPVIDYLERENLSLAAILLTHRHADHTGGVQALKARWSEAVVYGPANEAIAGLDVAVSDGARLAFPVMDLSFKVLDVPGHTEGHVAYFSTDKLFCGDVLFAGGCGRVFTGTYEQMANSLTRIANLPPTTLIYCAHEYTLANLGFALWVEPDNVALQTRIKQDGQSRAEHQPTVPSALSLELATNPFVRLSEPAVITAATKWRGQPLTTPSMVFHALRDWKDRDYD